MDVVPVKKYREPKYPKREEVLDNPELLKTVPCRWKDNVYVGVALSTLLAFSLTSCSSKETGGTNMTSKKAEVAPIFEHGKGRGAFGCSSIAPPSFLSEEEAFQVVQEEGEKYGIIFEKGGLELERVGIPETKYFLKPESGSGGFNLNNGGEINSSKTGDLQLDGYDAKNKIGFEFISSDDYDKWQVKQSIYSTVSDYDFLSTARVLRDGIKNKNGDSTIGIFYNNMEMLPHEDILKSNDWKALEERTKALAEEELRKQVKDFLDWLKAEGIM